MRTYPTISQYAASVSQPDGLFRTLEGLVCETDTYGGPLLFAGGNAAVFKVDIGGKKYALKCYTRPPGRLRDVYEYIAGTGSGLLYETRYLPGEVFVYDTGGHGTWHDAVLTEWADGRTLEFEIRKAIHDGNAERLAILAGQFDSLAAGLLAQEWAHGDIKPDNITVSPEGGMRLIDYDAVFFPASADGATQEVGTPAYQHPLRDHSCYGKHIDDYPLALISATLHCLAADTDAHHRFGDPDCFLFPPAGTVAGRSPALSHFMGIAARSGDTALYRLLEALRSPTPHISGIMGIFAATGQKGISVRDMPGTGPELSAFVHKGRWGYGDAEGRTVIWPVFDTALEFSGGLAAVALGGVNHFIDATGACIINCSRYERIKPFSEDLAAVKRDGLWGYIDMRGREVSAPRFMKAGPFRNGSARITDMAGNEYSIRPEDITNNDIRPDRREKS